MPGKKSGQCLAPVQVNRLQDGRSFDKKLDARKAVPRVCELDRLQYCGGIQPGDAQILGCMYNSRRVLRPACRQALADFRLRGQPRPGPLAQVHRRSNDILGSLVGVEDLRWH